MGGLLYFLDFNHGGRSRKPMNHKKHIHGMVAPKNSMEFPSDTLGYQHIYEEIPFSIQEKHHLKPNLHLSGSPVKRLIDEEMTKQAKSSHIGAPSVVARLMGLDALPSETKSSADSKGKTNNSMRNDVSRKTHANLCYARSKTVAPLPTGRRRDEPPCTSINSNSTTFNQHSKSKRPKPREHPQEEILQQFKKEFEAWQTKKVWEQTNAVGLREKQSQSREKQSHTPQATFMKENEEKHRDAKWKLTNYNSKAILDENIRGANSRHEGPMHEPCQTSPTDKMPLQCQTRPADSEYFVKSMEKSENPFSPTRIVVLRSDAEHFGDADDMWPSSSANAAKKELSMEEFLEEVRNRLRMEINGKSRSILRGSVVNVNSTKGSCCPRQDAQNIMAKQIRESVDRDTYTNLTPSESSRLYKSDIQHSESDTPEFSGDTRTILTEGLNNMLRNEEDAVASSSRAASSGTKLPTKEGNKSKSCGDAKRIEGKVVYWEDNHSSLSDKTRSFREEEISRPISIEVSPRKLVRTLSAPASGIAFGKILSEEHLLKGAHNQRKHEVTDKYSIRSKKNKKNHFDFKSRVSNLRHNLAFKGKLFGGKVHIADKKDASESECVKDNENIPLCVVNMSTTQTRPENPTEVPPSPASVTSSSNDDLCKPGHPSPVSPLDVSFIEGNQSPCLSRDIQCDFPQTSDEIKCNIPQTSREISCDIPPMSKENSCDNNELKPHVIEMSEEVEADVNIYKNEIMGVDDHEEAYMRNILTMAGLYKELAQDAIRWHSLPQMLRKWVFEEVKAFSDKHDKEDSDAPIMSYEVAHVNRKMMFDLVSEALQVIVDPFVDNLAIKRCLLMTAIAHGKTYERIFSQIHNLTHLSDEEFSLEGMAANDVKRAPWIPMIQEVVSEVGTEVTPLILHDLVEEFVLDMY